MDAAIALRGVPRFLQAILPRYCLVNGGYAKRLRKNYIHMYHGNASLLAESLEVIQQTSAVILAALEPSRTEIVTDAELAKVV